MAKTKNPEAAFPKDLAPLFRRVGEVIARVGGPEPGAVSVEFTDKGGGPFHYLIRGGAADLKAGPPPVGLRRLLEVRLDTDQLRDALSKARGPSEVLVGSKMKVRGNVGFANELMPHLVRVFAEAKAGGKERKRS